MSILPLNETWTDSDHDTAASEGWFMSNAYGSSVIPDGALVLERDDEAAKFDDDYEAMLWVMKRAQEGSPVHQKALRLNYSPEGAH